MAHKTNGKGHRRASTPPSTPVFSSGLNFDSNTKNDPHDDYDLDDEDQSPTFTYATHKTSHPSTESVADDLTSDFDERLKKTDDLTSDLDESAKKTDALTKDFTTVLTTVHALLTNLQSTIETTDEKVLTQKVTLCISDCARIVENVALELESRGEDGRREMCERMTMEVQREIGAQGGELEEGEEQFLKALSLAPSILQDVSSALYSISDEESAELTEVGMTVSLIFVSIAKGAVESVDVDGIVGELTNIASDQPTFERLDSDGNVLEESPIKPKKRSPLVSSRLQLQRRQPLVFWPRIIPFLRSIPNRMMEDFGPVISTMLLALMSPTLVFSGFVMSPLLLTDEVIHTLYDNLKKKDKATIVKHGSSGLQECEIVAARALEIMRLNYLVSKLTVKQGLRVAKRQLKRQGGVIGIAKTTTAKVFDCAIHPISTVNYAIDRTSMIVTGVISLFGVGIDLVKGHAEVDLRSKQNP
jgi:hypothetical protein